METVVLDDKFTALHSTAQQMWIAEAGQGPASQESRNVPWPRN